MNEDLSIECAGCKTTLWVHKTSYLEWTHGMCRDCYARQIVTEMFADARKDR